MKKTRDIQLLRVTKNAMTEASMNEDERHRREVDMLERNIRAAQTAHERNVQERKKQAAIIKKQIRNMTKDMDQLETKIDHMADQVVARESVHKIQQVMKKRRRRRGGGGGGGGGGGLK